MSDKAIYEILSVAHGLARLDIRDADYLTDAQQEQFARWALRLKAAVYDD